MKRDDKRQTCICGHRYSDHARGGTKCLAVSNDPEQRTGDLCGCYLWVRWNARLSGSAGDAPEPEPSVIGQLEYMEGRDPKKYGWHQGISMHAGPRGDCTGEHVDDLPGDPAATMTIRRLMDDLDECRAAPSLREALERLLQATEFPVGMVEGAEWGTVPLDRLQPLIGAAEQARAALASPEPDGAHPATEGLDVERLRFVPYWEDAGHDLDEAVADPIARCSCGNWHPLRVSSPEGKK